ncbi:eukaryotic initiation factor 4f subunit eIF4g, eIF4e-binding domain-containing protein, partial [Exidia glandulosa HHB12029]
DTRRRPGPINIDAARAPMTPGPMSALATARIITDINQIQYPENIKSPRIELNMNAKEGRFRYDRDFLMQFMEVCKEKPDHLPPPETLGLEPI